RPGEIRELAGRAERCQPVDARGDQVAAQALEHLRFHLARRVDRRDQVGEYPVEFHGHQRAGARLRAKNASTSRMLSAQASALPPVAAPRRVGELMLARVAT